MTAPRIEHRPADESTRVERPYFVFFTDPKPPWHLQSEMGVLPPGQVLVLLTGTVIITRESADGASDLQMQTRDLIVNTLDRSARTDQPAVIWNPQWRVDGVGLEMNLNSGQANMNDVRGVYDPPTP